MQVAEITVVDNSGEVKRNMEEAVIRALERCGLTAEAYAVLLCPVDTGRLRNSITHTVRESEDAAYIGTNVEYAAYVELGTSRMKAQPYLKPAVADHANEYRKIIETELNQVDNNFVLCYYLFGRTHCPPSFI